MFGSALMFHDTIKTSRNAIISEEKKTSRAVSKPMQFSHGNPIFRLIQELDKCTVQKEN